MTVLLYVAPATPRRWLVDWLAGYEAEGGQLTDVVLAGPGQLCAFTWPG